MKEHLKTSVERISSLFQNGNVLRLLVKVDNATIREAILNALFSKIESVDPSYDTMRISEEEKIIGIDSARRIKEFLSYPPSLASRKYIVIDEIGMATHEAIAALLKITEEPPNFSAFIFFASNVDQIISTVKSRFFILKFSIDPLSILPTDLVENVSDPFIKAMISIDPNAALMFEEKPNDIKEFSKSLQSDSGINVFLKAMKDEKENFMLSLVIEKILLEVDIKTLSRTFQKLQGLLQADKGKKISSIFFNSAILLCEDLIFFKFTTYWKNLNRKMYVRYYMDMKAPSEEFVKKVWKLKNENVNDDLSIFWLLLNFSLMKKV